MSAGADAAQLRTAARDSQLTGSDALPRAVSGRAQPDSQGAEDACIEFDTITTDLLGVSGRRRIQAILDGCDRPRELAERVKGTLRGKSPELRLALNGRITDHHRFMPRKWMEDLARVEAKLQRVEKEIAGRIDRQRAERLCSIPGVDTIGLDAAGGTRLRPERIGEPSACR